MPSTRSYTLGARAEGVVAVRERITRAALALLLEHPYEDVTLAQIASAARVSHQTVLNHFESKEGVARAAAEALRVETWEARSKAPPGDELEALAVLVEEYERIGDANARWAIASERLGSLAALLDEARAGHRDWLARIFADSLPSQSSARRRMLFALHAATDVYTWKLLRRDLKRSRAETLDIMVELVRGVLQLRPHKRARRRQR